MVIKKQTSMVRFLFGLVDTFTFDQDMLFFRIFKWIFISMVFNFN